MASDRYCALALPLTIARATVSLAAVATLLSCGGEPPAAAERARPVTVYELVSAAPEVPGKLSGLAEPYRQEAVGFQVGGPVDFVMDVGNDIEGPVLDATNAIIKEGDPLGTLDPTRFQQALNAADLAVAAAVKQLEALQVEVTTVAQSQLEQAKAQEQGSSDDIDQAQASVDFASAELSRKSKLLQDGVISRAEFDRAKSDSDAASAALQSIRSRQLAAQAGVQQAEDAIRLKEANIESTKAQIAQEEQRAFQANIDLEDCTLLAPFTGRITQRHIGRGGYVQPGQAVVTLTMMDPIMIVVMASAEKSRRLLPGSQVAIYPKDLDRFTDLPALYGVVFEKAEVADPSTRTFRIEIIVRNVRRQPFIVGPGGETGAAIEDIMPVIVRDFGASGPLFIHPRAILNENEQDYVLRIPGAKMGPGGSGELNGVLKPEKVAVERLDEFLTIRFSFQRIADGSGLEPGEIIVMDPRPEHLEGAVMASYDWAIRPGEIVPVGLELGSGEPGYYVPVEAIATLNGATRVFVVENGRARMLDVTVHESSGTLRRIESAELRDGMQLIQEGVHYVADGDSVTVVASIGA